MASYHDISHTDTGITPAEILLGRSPCTQLLLVYLCLSDQLTQKAEVNVGNKQLRKFDVNQKVVIHDFQPQCLDKWCQATISKCLDSLTYEAYEVLMELIFMLIICI